MVKQEAKELGIDFFARVQLDMYDDLFSRRSSGEKLIINKYMESQFLISPKTHQEQKIADSISKWRNDQITSLEAELAKQFVRQTKAKDELDKKTTKKAEQELRVSTSKIDQIGFKLKKIKSEEYLSEDEKSVFPYTYLSMITVDRNGERIVAPFRYHLRPSGQPETFDRKYNGCYNARRNNLGNSFWKPLFGKQHGIILVEKFYEHVATEDYLKKLELPKEQQNTTNTILCFRPEGHDYMIVPTLWDVNKQKGQPDLYSCAVITDEPPAEIAETGHNRCPIFIKPENVERWLNPGGRDLKELYEILADKQTPRYQHSVVNVA